MIRLSRLALACLGLAAVVSSPVSAEDAPAAEPAPSAPIPEGEGEWRAIFNGKDKEGWVMCGPGELKLEDGDLVTYGGMGMLWYEREKFGDCEIRIVFRLTDAGDNAGAFIRIPERPLSPMQAVNQGYEVQIDNNDDEWHRTGCLYSITKAREKVSPAVGEDATFLITLDGPRTVVRVNGIVVTDFTEGDPVPAKKKIYEPNRGIRPNEGYIGLQNHGGHAHVRFRDVSVRPLKKG